MRLLTQLLNFGASGIGEDLKCLSLCIDLSQHDGSGVDGSIRAHRGQHRRSPFVMPILTGTPKLFPDVLSDVLGCLKLGFHVRVM